MNTTEVIPDQGVLSSWSQNYTGTGIVIGIVDNGVEINHPDLLINQVRNIYHIVNQLIVFYPAF